MPIRYSTYPPNWNTHFRPKVLERAGNKCEFCGVPNYAVILRGQIRFPYLLDIYQDDNGNIFNANSGDKIGESYVGDIDNPAKDWIKIVLTIAHLDHDPENHEVSLDRLKALCQRCHLNYDREHRKKVRKINQDQLDLFNT